MRESERERERERGPQVYAAREREREREREKARERGGEGEGEALEGRINRLKGIKLQQAAVGRNRARVHTHTHKLLNTQTLHYTTLNTHMRVAKGEVDDVLIKLYKEVAVGGIRARGWWGTISLSL